MLVLTKSLFAGGWINRSKIPDPDLGKLSETVRNQSMILEYWEKIYIYMKNNCYNKYFRIYLISSFLKILEKDMLRRWQNHTDWLKGNMIIQETKERKQKLMVE